jgi:hypothetical protein
LFAAAPWDVLQDHELALRGCQAYQTWKQTELGKAFQYLDGFPNLSVTESTDLVLMELFAGNAQTSLMNQILEGQVIERLKLLDVKQAYIGDASLNATAKRKVHAKAKCVVQLPYSGVLDSRDEMTDVNVIFWFLGTGYIPQGGRKEFFGSIAKRLDEDFLHCGIMIFTE